MSGASTKSTLRSWLHSSDTTPSVFNMWRPVWFDQYLLRYETKNVSGIDQTFHNEDRWSRIRQLANVISFRVADAIFLDKCIFSATGRCCLKHYLWWEIEICMLYFSRNALVHSHFIVLTSKKVKYRLLSCGFNDKSKLYMSLQSQKSGIRLHQGELDLLFCKVRVARHRHLPFKLECFFLNIVSY